MIQEVKRGRGRPQGTLRRNWKGMVIPRITILEPTTERTVSKNTVWLCEDELGRKIKISGEYISKFSAMPVDLFEFQSTKMLRVIAQENAYVSPAVEGLTEVEEQVEELCTK